MLYREKIAVCSQIHIKLINTLSGQNVELPNVVVCTEIINFTRNAYWSKSVFIISF